MDRPSRGPCSRQPKPRPARRGGRCARRQGYVAAARPNASGPQKPHSRPPRTATQPRLVTRHPHRRDRNSACRCRTGRAGRPQGNAARALRSAAAESRSRVREGPQPGARPLRTSPVQQRRTMAGTCVQEAARSRTGAPGSTRELRRSLREEVRSDESHDELARHRMPAALRAPLGARTAHRWVFTL